MRAMRRRDIIALFGGALVARPYAARAQQSQPLPVIGILHASTPQLAADQYVAFRAGLKETGFVEGENVTFEYLYANGQFDRLPELAAEFVRRKVDVLVAVGFTTAALAAKNATTTIPVLFAAGYDPEKSGLVSNLRRPGGNLTGATMYTVALHAKRVQLLRDLIPSIKTGDTIATLVNRIPNGSEVELTDLDNTLADVGLKLRLLSAGTEKELEAAFAEASTVAKAMVVTADPFFGVVRFKVAELAARYKIPAIYPVRQFVEAGGLISYGVKITAAYHVIGNYAGRILKGANPGDLPVQNPTVFDLTVNRKAARELGLTLPRILLLQIDQIFGE